MMKMEKEYQKKIRGIPRLDVKGVNVVKGVHLEGLRVLGQPGSFAEAYYLEGADEIIYMDSVASLYGRNNLHNIVSEAAEHIFIPMTVGGGIRSLDDVQSLLKAGADKVAINTALFQNPELITLVAERFGSQCMVVSIDVVANETGGYDCLTDNGRENTGVELMDWVDKVVALGAGEILLTSVDMEGTGRGFDIELIKKVTLHAPIPVIACGGAGSNQHVLDVIKHADADAISVASILHYDLLSRVSTHNDTNHGNKAFLQRAHAQPSVQLRKGIESTTLTSLKEDLMSHDINIRNKTPNRVPLK